MTDTVHLSYFPNPADQRMSLQIGIGFYAVDAELGFS